MKQLSLKPFFVGAALVVALGALTSIAPVSADRDAWMWTDKSASLPQRDGVSLVLSAERQGSWLLSDGRALVRFDGSSVTDLSLEARDHNLNSIKLLASDGRQWLVWNKPLDDRRGSLWLRDGSSWTDLTNALPTSVESLEASGHDGQWYLNVTANGITRLVFVNGTASIPQDVTLPLESSKLGHAAFVNGRWFWFGEQAGRAMAWSINGLDMTALKGVPASLPISGVWSNDSSALIATANGLFVFDGSTWTELSAQAKALGLSTEGLKAAYGGASWMIVSGTNLYRYDGSALASKGMSKDRILSVSGGNGFAVTAKDSAGWAKLQSVDDAIAEAQVAPAPITNTNVVAIAEAVTAPALATDASTGIAYASWTVPSATSLPSGANASYFVSAREKNDGLSSIEIWVNGKNAKTCALGGIKSQTTCEFPISATSYPVGTDIFMNARITDAKGQAFWIPAMTLTRPNTVIATAPAPTTAPAVQSGTVFASRLTLSPDVTDIRRGGTLTVRAFGQDSRVGLDRIEISHGGQIRQICRYGVAMSEVKCELTIDAATFADNTSLSFVARAINADGQEAWSNGRTVTVRAANWSPTPVGAAVATDGITRWSWLNPPTAQIEATQETTYSVGTWSNDGIAKIEMVVNGATRKTCAFVSGTVARDCAYVIRTGDWNHGQVVTVNARITDMKGRVAWTDASTVTISRAWWEPLNAPGPYVTLSATKNDSFSAGDKLGFILSGWSPNGADRLELYLNGSRVATCPSDICRFTSPALVGDRVEYQARLVDAQGKETWTALYGLNRK